jgi:hypothetical protein
MICSSTRAASDTGIGEADAERAAGLREDRAVDADQVARVSTSAPPELPGVDRRVGLDEVLEAIDAEVAAAQRADDAHRHRVAEAERIADREHDVADVHGLQVAEGDRRQLVGLRLEHREIDSGSTPAPWPFSWRPSASTSWMSSAPSITW